MDEKYCPMCEQNKPRSEFYRNRANSGGLGSYCKKCKLALNRVARKKRPTREPLNIEAIMRTLTPRDY